MNALRTGPAIAVTIALLYLLRMLIEVSFPKQFMRFMNALFHALDFRRLATSEPHHWLSFLDAPIVMPLRAVAPGAFLVFIHNALSGVRRRAQLVPHE